MGPDDVDEGDFGLGQLRRRGEALGGGLRGLPLKGRCPATECARRAAAGLPWLAADLPDLRTADALDWMASERFGRAVTFDPDLRMWTASPDASAEDLERAVRGVAEMLEDWEAVEEVMEA